MGFHKNSFKDFHWWIIFSRKSILSLFKSRNFLRHIWELKQYKNLCLTCVLDSCRKLIYLSKVLFEDAGLFQNLLIEGFGWSPVLNTLNAVESSSKCTIDDWSWMLSSFCYFLLLRIHWKCLCRKKPVTWAKDGIISHHLLSYKSQLLTPQGARASLVLIYLIVLSRSHKPGKRGKVCKKGNSRKIQNKALKERVIQGKPGKFKKT